jgi:DNA-binding IclR family transcriptional regulator
MKAPPTVLCTRCRGTGYCPLPPRALETLAAVPAKGSRSTVWIAETLGIRHTAVCRRLGWLEERGFIKRAGAGRRYDVCLWRRA